MNRVNLRRMLLRPGVHWIWLSAAIYLIACGSPALKVGDGANGVLFGWQCLTLFPVPWWWPNPLYFIAILTYLFKLRRIAVVLSGLALLPALHLEFITWSEQHPILIGCILWTVSIQLVFLNALWHAWIDRKQRLESLSSTHPA